LADSAERRDAFAAAFCATDSMIVSAIVLSLEENTLMEPDPRRQANFTAEHLEMLKALWLARMPDTLATRRFPFKARVGDWLETEQIQIATRREIADSEVSNPLPRAAQGLLTHGVWAQLRQPHLRRRCQVPRKRYIGDARLI
jgi:hypothetical protein